MKKANRTIARRFSAVVATSVAAVGLLAAVGLAEELPPPDGVTTETTTVVDAKKTDVCHKGRRTIRISLNAVPAHLRHGDLVGPCADDVYAAKRAAKAAKRAAKAAKRALKAGGAVTDDAAVTSRSASAPSSGGPGGGKAKGKSKHGG